MVRVFLYLLAYLTPPPTIQSCVAYWQQQLHLQDWTIAVQVVSVRDLDAGTLGDIRPDLETRSAVLRIMRATDSDLSGRRALAEQRLTILHEMVHLRSYANGDRQWGSEHATNATTGDLVRQHRRWFEELAIER